jgi:hypothetical protein
MTHLHQYPDYVVEDITDDGPAFPNWALAVTAILCGIGLLLLGTVAGHVWSLTYCIDPGAFGLPS